MDIRFQANRSSTVATVLTGCFLAVSGAAMVHGQTAAPAFRVIAFYNGKVEAAHASFVAEANRWFPKMAAQQGFAYESTDDWSKLNRESLSRYELVVFLDARPDVPAQREAFRAYMERGGGWMGFHFAGFALTPSEFPQNWGWYHNEFLGAGSYAGNTWRPTTAVLKVEDKTHPVTQGLPDTFKSAPNEWYKWSTDLRTNANIKILLSIDPASFPLGTGPKTHEIWHTGYYPVVWTNVKYRMVYFNMGHNDIDFANKPGKQLSSTFASDVQNKLILNTVMWLGKGNAAAPRPAPASGKPTALSVLNYLKQIGRRQTVAGIHNREPNSRTSMQTDGVARLTGRYQEALAKCRRVTRTEGIDAVMDKAKLDAVVAPCCGPAAVTDLLAGDRGGGGDIISLAAVAGYPSITVPAGFFFGLPIGLCFLGRAWSEPTLFKLAYGFEQATKARKPPEFLPTVDLRKLQNRSR